MSDDAVIMPRYQSHKVVGALQIATAIQLEGGAQLYFREAGFAARVVGPDVVGRRFPETGDYLVQYEDGYLSISPREPFEAGYTRFDPAASEGEVEGEVASIPPRALMYAVGDLGPARRHLARLVNGQIQPSIAVFGEINAAIQRCVERLEDLQAGRKPS